MSDSRPNILWISLEDTTPRFGCYGDPLARTPNLDRLASQGVRFSSERLLDGGRVRSEPMRRHHRDVRAVYRRASYAHGTYKPRHS